MKERGVPWYLFGAQAAIIWGSSRYSNDVDVTVSIDRENLLSFIDAMKKAGFDIKYDDMDFIERSRVLPFTHDATGLSLDVVLLGPGLEEEFLDRKQAVDVDGTTIPVISREDLIILKILAGRAKDIEDIKAVIYEYRTTLDRERITSMLRLLEQALTQSDLLPAFEKAWETAPRPRR